jgi:very-short-patch-repair endonuclease
MAKLETLIFEDKPIRRFITDDGFEAYYSTDIGNILGIKRVRDSFKQFNEDEIVSPANRQKYEIATYQQYRDNIRKNNKMILLTKQGLVRFVSISRSVRANDLAKFLGIPVHGARFTPVEADTLKIIMDAFNGDNMKLQHKFGDYKVDLFFPDHNLIIECDERGHSDRDPRYEKTRQEFIEREGHKFIRYNPHDPDFSIINVINSIYRHIVS